MTNAQSFSFPEINLRFNKSLILDKKISGVEIQKVEWGSLLGKDNNELIRTMLIHSANFSFFIEEAKKDFLKNPEKFPGMSESDWK